MIKHTAVKQANLRHIFYCHELACLTEENKETRVLPAILVGHRYGRIWTKRGRQIQMAEILLALATRSQHYLLTAKVFFLPPLIVLLPCLFFTFPFLWIKSCGKFKKAKWEWPVSPGMLSTNKKIPHPDLASILLENGQFRTLVKKRKINKFIFYLPITKSLNGWGWKGLLEVT